MNTKERIYWVDNFTLLSLCSILRLTSFDFRRIKIIYYRSSRVFLYILRIITILFFKQVEIEKVRFSLGNMKSERGEALRYEVEELSGCMALDIARSIKATGIYQSVKGVLPSQKLDVYITKAIKNEIYTMIITVCVINWHRRNGGTAHHTIVWTERDILSLLKNVYPDKSISLILYRRFFKINKQTLKSIFLNLWLDTYIKLYFLAKHLKIRTAEDNTQPITIAVMYGEGVDLNRRSDIFWHAGSNIPPERILIYFVDNGLPLPNRVIADIENMGMRWVCLKRGRIKGKKIKIWSPGIELGRFPCEFNLYKLLRLAKKTTSSEKWILATVKYLLFYISYWSVFYKSFGTKISFEIGESDDQNISKSMALDFIGGIMTGRQRSEYAYPKEFPIGHFPQHVFFGWNKRMAEYLRYPLNTVENYVISGFCHDYIFKQNKEYSKRLREQLNGKGVKFAIALYDNVFGDRVHYSPEMMKIFYKKFLDWMFSDKEVGIILKPKKIAFIEKHLPEVKELISHAQKTGRCIIPPDSTGRFPSDISYATDMAVGIGIASSVVEAVIGGSRGMMCDLPNYYSHFLYKDGYKRVVFNDIDRLIEALKKYKENAEGYEELGNFSPWMDLLDPFRDGKAAERIGSYIQWCLEGFAKEMHRDKIIERANSKYADHWGSDKIIKISPYPNSAVLRQAVSI